MKRYAIVAEPDQRGWRRGAEVIPTPNGKWVKYEDAQKLEVALRDIRERIYNILFE